MKPELQNKLTKKYSEFFQYLKKYKTPMLNPNESLVKSFKKLNEQKNIIVPMQFGFECGDGWYWLLDNLMGSIKWHIDQENKSRSCQPKYKFLNNFSFKLRIRIGRKIKLFKKIGVWIQNKQPRGVSPIYFQIDQIKEKYGGLRFYFSGGDKDIRGMINLAESMSESICEFCGATENVGQTQGWIYTICGKCIKKNSRAKELKWKVNK